MNTPPYTSMGRNAPPLPNSLPNRQRGRESVLPEAQQAIHTSGVLTPPSSSRDLQTKTFCAGITYGKRVIRTIFLPSDPYPVAQIRVSYDRQRLSTVAFLSPHRAGGWCHIATTYNLAQLRTTSSSTVICTRTPDAFPSFYTQTADHSVTATVRPHPQHHGIQVEVSNWDTCSSQQIEIEPCHLLMTALSPQGDYLALMTSTDRRRASLQMWSTSNLTCSFSYNLPRDATILTTCFTRSYIVVTYRILSFNIGSWLQASAVWDTETGRFQTLFSGTYYFWQRAIDVCSSDHSNLLTARVGQKLTVCNLDERAYQHYSFSGPPIKSCSVSPDGSVLAFLCRDNSLHFMDTDNGSLLFRTDAHAQQVEALSATTFCLTCPYTFELISFISGERTDTERQQHGSSRCNQRQLLSLHS